MFSYELEVCQCPERATSISTSTGHFGINTTTQCVNALNGQHPFLREQSIFLKHAQTCVNALNGQHPFLRND